MIRPTLRLASWFDALSLGAVGIGRDALVSASRVVVALVAPAALVAALATPIAHAQSSAVVTGPVPTAVSGPLALVGGTVHPVSSAPIENATVLVEGGRITAVGPNLAPPAGTRVIDCRGQHVYPGFVSANTRLGLIEISAVLGSDDTQETGNTNPNARAEVMINPESDLIPVARINGVTSALVIPGGGSVSGTSALVHLDGWTAEDMTIRAPLAMHVTWPNVTPARDAANPQAEEEQNKQRDQRLDEIRRAFDDARAYARARAAESQPGIPRHDADVRWEAMRRALAGEIPFVFKADALNQIRAVLKFVDEQKLLRVILLGGRDAPLVADELRARDIPVIVAGVLVMPSRRWEHYDQAFTVAARLASAGVRYCIADDGGNDDAANARNLPYHAGMAAAFGLDRDEALKAITLYPARILGVADQLGSIEVGKWADLQVTNGDPLEISTTVSHVIIAGRDISMESRQTRLFHKYDSRPRSAHARTR